MDRVRLLLGSRRWLLLAALALLSLALGSAMFSGASFSSKSANSAALGAASIKLSSTRPDEAIVESTAGMKPGDSSSGTVSITNLSDLPAPVTLKAVGLSGAELASAITLKIEDITSGTTKKYEDKLASFSSLSLGSFAVNATRKYRFTLSWPEASNEPSLQGLSTSLTFQWEGAGSA